MPHMVVTDLKDRVLGNRYKLLRPLGKGGMALVFEAHDQLLERPVAIKLLRKDFSTDPEFRDRFLHEARSAANLSHPNIVTVYDFGIDDGEIYIVMELATGSDLKTSIEKNGPFSLDSGLELGIQICTGLGYAHRAGIVHCDIKPQNIIITNDKVAKLTDFGISRALNSPSSSERSDVVWGSPQYLAPELIEGETPSPSSDVYSLGAVLYEIFTGKPPFEGDSVDELLTNHTNKTPQRITSQVNDFPDDLDYVISKTLSKETTQRYRTAEQLCSVLMLIKKRISSSPSDSTHDARSSPIIPPQLPVFVSYEDKPSLSAEGKASADWRLIGLELLCLLLAGGLIPFWIFVWFTIKPLLE